MLWTGTSASNLADQHTARPTFICLVMQVELRYEARVSRQNRSIISPLALKSAVRLRSITLDDVHTSTLRACPHPNLLMASSGECSTSPDHGKDVLPNASFLLQVDVNSRTLPTTSLLPQRQALIPSDNLAAQGGLKARHTLCKRCLQGSLLSEAFLEKGTAPMDAQDGLHPANLPGINVDVLQQWFRSDVASPLHSVLDDASLAAVLQLLAARMRLLGTFVQCLALNLTYDHGEPADDVHPTH
jgi:hypothetical protein